MQEISLEEFRIRSRQSTTHIVDVLPPQRFRSGHIPGAINLPVDEVSRDARRTLPRLQDEIIVYCGSDT